MQHHIRLILAVSALGSLASLGVTGAQGTAPTAPGTSPSNTAQRPSPVQITAVTYRVNTVNKDGKVTEELEDVSKVGVLPGNLLQLQQNLKNVGVANLRGLTLNMQVPGPTTFVSAKCSQPVTTLYSIDGKTFGPAPLKKRVKVVENGVSVEREVEVKPAEYTHVRWQIASLNAGETVQCFIRATVR